MENQKESEKPAIKEKKVTPVQMGEDQRKVVITTDGKNVNISCDDMSHLEIEMVLIKSLTFIRSQY